MHSGAMMYAPVSLRLMVGKSVVNWTLLSAYTMLPDHFPLGGKMSLVIELGSGAPPSGPRLPMIGIFPAAAVSRQCVILLVPKIGMCAYDTCDTSCKSALNWGYQYTPFAVLKTSQS